MGMAKPSQHGLVIVPLTGVSCGVRALGDYQVPQLPAGSASPEGLFWSCFHEEEIPQGARKFLPGQGADILVSQVPCSQSAMELPPTDKHNEAQQKLLELKQTDLGEAGRGVRPASSRLWARPLSW